MGSYTYIYIYTYTYIPISSHHRQSPTTGTPLCVGLAARPARQQGREEDEAMKVLLDAPWDGHEGNHGFLPLE